MRLAENWAASFRLPAVVGHPGCVSLPAPATRGFRGTSMREFAGRPRSRLPRPIQPGQTQNSPRNPRFELEQDEKHPRKSRSHSAESSPTREPRVVGARRSSAASRTQRHGFQVAELRCSRAARAVLGFGGVARDRDAAWSCGTAAVARRRRLPRGAHAQHRGDPRGATVLRLLDLPTLINVKPRELFDGADTHRRPFEFVTLLLKFLAQPSDELL